MLHYFDLDMSKFKIHGHVDSTDNTVRYTTASISRGLGYKSDTGFQKAVELVCGKRNRVRKDAYPKFTRGYAMVTRKELMQTLAKADSLRLQGGKRPLFKELHTALTEQAQPVQPVQLNLSAGVVKNNIKAAMSLMQEALALCDATD